MPLLLVRYGEIGLKSASVRKRFEQSLVNDISRRHALAGTPCVITVTRGRLFVESGDWRRTCDILSRTFGVVSFSPAVKTSSDLDTLRKDVLAFGETLMSRDAAFAVRARRVGQHPYTSQELARILGSDLLERFKDLPVSVRLDSPDVEVFVEVRQRDAYLFSSVLRGPGGMPLGTQGAVLSVVDSPKAVASSWMMMKRGCKVIVSAEDSSLASPLMPWDPELETVAFSDDLFSAARSLRCSGVVLPWSLSELEDRGTLKGDLPVFYPLVGLDESDVSRLLERVTS
jgi:thiamine biosynthesis protein ThiI